MNQLQVLGYIVAKVSALRGVAVKFYFSLIKLTKSLAKNFTRKSDVAMIS